MRYCFQQDEDGHWYLVPEHKMEEWTRLRNLVETVWDMEGDEDDLDRTAQDREVDFINFADQFRIGNGPHWYWVENPTPRD